MLIKFSFCLDLQCLCIVYTLEPTKTDIPPSLVPARCFCFLPFDRPLCTSVCLSICLIAALEALSKVVRLQGNAIHELTFVRQQTEHEIGRSQPRPEAPVDFQRSGHDPGAHLSGCVRAKMYIVEHPS